MSSARPAHGPYSHHHTLWNLDAFDQFGDASRRISDRQTTRYSVRALRYWFMDHLIQREHARRQEPLAVCEVGVGDGSLFRFVNRIGVGNVAAGRASWISSWDAVSRRVDRSTLQAIGYSSCVEANVEQVPLRLTQQYDVLVLLHILEHLYEPEATLERLLPAVKPGGIVIGGAPTLPDVIRSVRERQLRKKALPFGHVSVISPHRLNQVAKRLQLSVELLTGAYVLRATGSQLEHSRLWLRVNLFFGALCPSWPGEVYWSFRKPIA